MLGPLRLGVLTDAWVAPLVKRPTLDFNSGHDLTSWDQALHQAPCSADSLLEILSSSPSALPAHSLSLYASLE